MRSSTSIVFILLSFPLFSQWILKPIARPENQRIDEIKEDLPPVNLPFWDDFSTAGDVPGILWENSDGIYVNTTMAIAAPSYKVATFDGINATGEVYDESEKYPGLTDQLMSRKVDLSAYPFDETIYLSFFWEMGGNGEIPDSSGDSLRLQFLNANDVWVTVWKQRAPLVTINDQFTQSILNVSSAYRHANFRFKFESFGSQQGPFDTWHVDYVYLDVNRSTSDTFHADQAFSGDISSFIAPFSEMPASHFFIDPNAYTKTVTVDAFNLANNPSNAVITSNFEILDKAGDVIQTISFPDDGSNTLDIGPVFHNFIFDADDTGGVNPDDPITFTPIDPAPDSVVINFTLSSNFSLTDIYPENNSISRQYVFYDRYAYDDGTAEYAVGVRQNGTVAVEYNIQTKDTLTHVDIHFPAITPTSVNKAMTLKVWADLDQDPVSTTSFTVSSTGRNEFLRIKLSPAVVVTDKIYVGYTQKSADYVGIGLDRSNPTANDKIYYKIEGDWEQNADLNGVLMIRAVFEEGAELVLSTSEPSVVLNWYPNPTSGFLTIQSEYSSIRVWTLDGKQQLIENRKDAHDLSFLPTGVYLLEVSLPNNTTQKFKLVKK